jgi:hypothetical protein
MVKQILGFRLVIAGVFCAPAAVLMSMATNFHLAALRRAKTSRALGYPAEALSKHPDLHLPRKRIAKIMWLFLGGVICRLIGSGILQNL